MEKNSRELPSASSDFLGTRWFDPIEVAIRDRVRGFIEELVEAELDDALGRSRYRRPGATQQYRGTWGDVEVKEGGTWKTRMLTWSIIEAPPEPATNR